MSNECPAGQCSAPSASERPPPQTGQRRRSTTSASTRAWSPIVRPMEILPFDELRNPNGSVEFEGAEHGGTDVSFFVLDLERGRGPSLHKHDYAEVCILLEGQATFQ